MDPVSPLVFVDSTAGFSIFPCRGSPRHGPMAGFPSLYLVRAIFGFNRMAYAEGLVGSKSYKENRINQTNRMITIHRLALNPKKKGNEMQVIQKDSILLWTSHSISRLDFV